MAKTGCVHGVMVSRLKNYEGEGKHWQVCARSFTRMCGDTAVKLKKCCVDSSSTLPLMQPLADNE